MANRNSCSNQRFFGNGFSETFSENPLLDFAITLQNHYYYALIGLLLPLCFLLNPSFSNNKTYWFDGFLGFLSVGVCGFFFANAETMLDYGWEFSAPDHAVWMSYVLWALIMEGVRRTGGWILFVLVFVFFSLSNICRELTRTNFRHGVYAGRYSRLSCYEH